MLEIRDNIDSIVQELDVLVDRIAQEYTSINIDPNSDFSKGTAYIGFRIGRDYFKSAKKCVTRK